MPKGKRAARASMPKSGSSSAEARSVRAAGAASGAGKTVSKASLKRAAQQSTVSLEPSKSCKVSNAEGVHSGLTPKLAKLHSGDGGVPDTFTLDGDDDDSHASRTRAAGTGKRRRQPVHPASSKAFLHVGPGGSGKRYTGISAEKAAKKAWRDSKHLEWITVRAVDGGQESTLKASAWTGSGGDGVGAKKFGKKSTSSRRDKGAAFHKQA